MIEISRNSIFLQDAEGRATPFSIDDVRDRVLRALPSELPEAEAIARDTAYAVDFSLRKGRVSAREPLYVKAAAVDSMILNILSSIGCGFAAEEYRKNSCIASFAEEASETRIACFLEETLGLSGDRLAQTARKVANTLRSIGGDESNQALTLELAKHFLRVSDAVSSLSASMPIMHPRDFRRIPAEECLPRISEQARRLMRIRALRMHSVDLRIFPALRLDVRLFPIQKEKGYAPPLTELTLGADFAEIANAIDELCLVADSICRFRGREDATPLKTILHFADATLFVREFMACPTEGATEDCIRTLADFLCGMMTRQPVKITCG